MIILLKIQITSYSKTTSIFELILESLHGQVETFVFLITDYPLRLSFDNKLSSSNLLFKPVPIHFGPESKLIVLFDVFLRQKPWFTLTKLSPMKLWHCSSGDICWFLIRNLRLPWLLWTFDAGCHIWEKFAWCFKTAWWRCRTWISLNEVFFVNNTILLIQLAKICLSIMLFYV